MFTRSRLKNRLITPGGRRKTSSPRISFHGFIIFKLKLLLNSELSFEKKELINLSELRVFLIYKFLVVDSLICESVREWETQRGRTTAGWKEIPPKGRREKLFHTFLYHCYFFHLTAVFIFILFYFIIFMALT